MKKKFSKNKIVLVCFFAFLLSIGIGYAYLSETLSTKTSINILNSWDILLTNVEYIDGSINETESVRIEDDSTIKITTSISDTTQYLSFYTTIENKGDIDAMFEKYEVLGFSDYQKQYYDLLVTYNDESNINPGDLLSSKSYTNIKTTLKLKDGVDINQLEETETNLELTLSFYYNISA